MDFDMLNKKLKQSNVSEAEILQRLEFNKSTLNRKLLNKSEFKKKEIDVLIDILNLSKDEVMRIFFN